MVLGWLLPFKHGLRGCPYSSRALPFKIAVYGQAHTFSLVECLCGGQASTQEDQVTALLALGQYVCLFVCIPKHQSVAMQASLTGNGARVAVVCTITPASSQAEETHNTLKFATRAKKVMFVPSTQAESIQKGTSRKVHAPSLLCS